MRGGKLGAIAIGGPSPQFDRQVRSDRKRETLAVLLVAMAQLDERDIAER